MLWICSLATGSQASSILETRSAKVALAWALVLITNGFDRQTTAESERRMEAKNRLSIQQIKQDLAALDQSRKI